jgi:Fe2+ or Zn2+ uptake regulation protein
MPINLRKARRILPAQHTLVARGLKVTLPRLAVLAHLQKSPAPQSISDISEATDISTSTLYRVLTTLHKKGIVREVPASQKEKYNLIRYEL